MFCLRCGKEIRDGESHVYCTACREDMERYPVPQGTAIQLPSHPSAGTSKKASRKRELKPEEQIARLRRANRWLILLLAAAVLLFALAAAMLIHLQTGDEPPVGRNFPAASHFDGK